MEWSMEYYVMYFLLGSVVANEGGSLLHKKVPSLCTQYLALNEI